MKNPRRQAAGLRVGKSSRDTGQDFEDWVEVHHREAIRLGILVDVQHNVPHAIMIHGSLEWVKSGVSDYTGILHNGHATTLGVEAKKRTDRLYRREIEPKQAAYLDSVLLGGGVALLLARIVDDGEATEYAVPWKLVPWTVVKSAESVTSKELAPWRIPLDRTCYLDPFCPVRGVPVVIGTRRFPRE